MSNDKIKIIHFHNGSGGGVLSVIRNLLAYNQHSVIENHVIYTINLEHFKNYEISSLPGAFSEQVFYYSPSWNFYYTCRQLAKLINDQTAIIVAHDWLELGMVSNLGLQNPVVHYVHGSYNYYYTLAVRHSPWIDAYVTVSQKISDELNKLLPDGKGRVHYLKFPVPSIKCKTQKTSSVIQILYAGRYEDSKGITVLPKIEELLLKSDIRVKWQIVGKGSELKDKQNDWPIGSDVKFHGNLEYSELIQILCNSHLLILPSLAEGMPMIVVEAMKAGVVPLVNDLSGGLEELIVHGVTGFRIPNNQIELYASYIEELYNNEFKRQLLSIEAKKFALSNFDPEANTLMIEKIFLNQKKASQLKKQKKVYGSKLDYPFIPNFLTFVLRQLKLHIMK